MEDLLIAGNENVFNIIKLSLADKEKLDHQLDLFLNWLTYQKHLPQNIDPNILRNFLVGCKGNMEKAKEKITRYCYSYLTHPDLVSDKIVTMEGDLIATEFLYLFPLPKLTPEGYRIYMIKTFDRNKLQLTPVLRYVILLIEFLLYKSTFTLGESLFFDGTTFQTSDFAKVFTNTLFRYIKMSLRAYPVRIKQVVILCNHPLVEASINLVKKVIPEKMRDRFIMVTDPKDLQKYIPEECLPSDYGGGSRSLSELSIAWRDHLIENQTVFKELNQIRGIGPIPDDLKEYSDEFGTVGSFRKLNID